MERREAAATVEAFFAEVGRADLHLPDGWYGGRPGENLHALTFVATRPDRLLVELDDNLLLTFSGPVAFRRETSYVMFARGSAALALEGFDQLVLDAAALGPSPPDARIYKGGTATFVSPRPSSGARSPT